MSRQPCYRLYSKFCVFLLTLSLPVYQNVHVNSVCEKVSCHWRYLFYFHSSTGNIYKYKGTDTCLEEFLMLLVDRNFNSFAISNKQAHIMYHLEWTYDGAFEQLFGLGWGEFEQKFSKNSNARGFARGGMLKLWFDWYITSSRVLSYQ